MDRVNSFSTLGESLKNINWLLRKAHIKDWETETEVLLSYVLKLGRSELYLNRQRVLGDKEQKKIEKALRKRLQNIPLQYITKHQEFMGIDFLVDRGVLIPRPETEILVEECIKRLRAKKISSLLKVLDLGTGSGVIAISIARFIYPVLVYAVDISAPSLRLASLNAARLDCKEKIIFLKGDWFKPLAGKVKAKSLDAIISNPPYISSSDFVFLPEEIRNYEPLIALDGGIQGLESFSQIISQAPYFLKRGGFLALEVGIKQALAVKRLILKEKDFRGEVEIIRDYSGIERVIIAYRK